MNPALEGFTLPKVLWLREHEPAAFRRLAKLVLPKDYIRLRLTGTLATEPSDASATLMFDTGKRRWSREILKAVKLPDTLVADLVGSAEISGRIDAAAAAATGLREGTPVAGGARGIAATHRASTARQTRTPCSGVFRRGAGPAARP